MNDVIGLRTSAYIGRAECLCTIASSHWEGTAQSTATILHPFWYSAWIDSNWIQGGIHVFNIQRFRTSGATAPEVHNYFHARTHATATHTQINNCKKNYSQVLFNKRLKFLEGALRYQPVMPRWRLFTQMKISVASIKANMQALRRQQKKKNLGKKKRKRAWYKHLVLIRRSKHYSVTRRNMLGETHAPYHQGSICTSTPWQLYQNQLLFRKEREGR